MNGALNKRFSQKAFHRWQETNEVRKSSQGMEIECLGAVPDWIYYWVKWKGLQ